VPKDLSQQNPFALTNLDQMRPTTKFVKLCDVWRNTIRASVLVPKEWTQNDLFKDSGIFVDLMDCMGPEMYDSSNSLNNNYFGMCDGTLQSNGQNYTISKPSVPYVNVPSYTLPNTTGGVPGTTPWTSGSQVWSPFTGGSFWNTFEKSASDTTRSDPVHFQFSPQLWYPSYSWNLANPDVNNVWPTSIATNPFLLKSNMAGFSSTDGSLRRMTLGSATSESYVDEITGPESFYNNGINNTGINFVESYVDVGRIYNLTYWQNNWWFTADTASIWTTAPTPSGLILCNPTFRDTFELKGLKFRPLSLEEGNPLKWAQANWPPNKAHKFNVMRVIDYEGSQALFVSSIDGEYIILTLDGTSFRAKINQENKTTFYTPKMPPYSSDSSSEFISDIVISGDNVVIASLPLPLNPQLDPEIYLDQIIPWANSALPIVSLGYTGPNANGPVLLLQSQDWLSPLEDSNIVTIDYDLALYSRNNTDDNVGTFVSNYNIDPIDPPNGQQGISRIMPPSYATSSDLLLPFYKSNTTFMNSDITVVTKMIQYDSLPVINFSLLFNNKYFPS
jgi:hypothetical protein